MSAVADTNIFLSSSLETERDYYFGKLREVEVLTQHIEAPEEMERSDVPGVIKGLQDILYKDSDNAEFGGGSSN